MAVRGGFAAKQGLKLELPYFQNDVIALRGLLAGELESYEGGAATAILAGARGGDVRIVGCHWQTVVHSVFARAELKGPQDLKGATMAISAPNATPDMIGKAWLAQNNVPFSEVKFASLGNDPERYKAMIGGIALATVISIEFLPIGKNDGIKLVARGSEVMPKYLRLCTVTTGKLIASRREDAVRFLAAQMQGYRHALANREEELRITREITGIKAHDPRPEFMFAEAARSDTGIDPRMPLAWTSSPGCRSSWSRAATWRSPTISAASSTATSAARRSRAPACSRNWARALLLQRIVGLGLGRILALVALGLGVELLPERLVFRGARARWHVPGITARPLRQDIAHHPAGDAARASAERKAGDRYCHRCNETDHVRKPRGQARRESCSRAGRGAQVRAAHARRPAAIVRPRTFRSGRRPSRGRYRPGPPPAWSRPRRAIPCTAPCQGFRIPDVRASHHPITIVALCISRARRGALWRRKWATIVEVRRNLAKSPWVSHFGHSRSARGAARERARALPHILAGRPVPTFPGHAQQNNDCWTIVR